MVRCMKGSDSNITDEGVEASKSVRKEKSKAINYTVETWACPGSRLLSPPVVLYVKGRSGQS